VAHLPNAPIYYVIGVLRFPRLPDTSRFLSLLQTELRSKYPLSDDKNAPLVEIEMGNEGLRLKQRTMNFWQMATLKRDRAVFVGPDVLGLHTIRYQDRFEFIGEFAQIVEIAQRLPDVGIKVVNALGLRYVDVIEPGEGEVLENYIHQQFLPGPIKEAPELEFQSGVTARGFKTPSGFVRVQLMRRPENVLPPDLVSPMTDANEWGKDRPTGDFAVLDMDHGKTFNPPEILNISRVKPLLLELHSAIRAIFDSVATPHAMRAWDEER
jgi:uncharacterized protein (TIGR04255 family)